ncbi:MAG: PLP-dependent aspartate aminotransferase family protein [Tepidanaerobacteraceae bacterium]|nr:PLP-dependent aspartate aminotransferase family protein [Tepidanaerobacteraceae bacterium]
MKNVDFSKLNFETIAVHGGAEPCPVTGAIVSPIYQTSTYTYENTDIAEKIQTGKMPGFKYGRDHSKTEIELEEKIALLEGGEACKAFASGMAAIAAANIGLLNAGDHVVCSEIVYGGTFGLFKKLLSRYGVEITYVDTNDSNKVEAAIKKNTKILYVETPGNPTLGITDLETMAEIAKLHNLKFIVDNTFMTPYFQNPLKFGADIVVHSATKYMSGHGDCLGGAVIGKKDFIQKALHDPVTKLGATISPFTCFLIKRGLQTLPLRMEKHQQNAMSVAKYLEDNPKVEKVLYPGLKSNSQHELAKKQMRGFGGVVSFHIKGGLAETKKLLDNLNLIHIAVSLGDVGTLIEIPSTMTHQSVSPEIKAKYGLTDSFIRISCGIENTDDLLNDLDQAFSKI